MGHALCHSRSDDSRGQVRLASADLANGRCPDLGRVGDPDRQCPFACEELCSSRNRTALVLAQSSSVPVVRADVQDDALLTLYRNLAQ